MASRMPELVRSLTILNSPHPIASAEARQIPEQQQKAWYMLLFQFAGVAEEWLAKDDFANLRSFVFETAAPGTFPPDDRQVFCAALAREGRLTAALDYYRANIPPETWLKPPPDLPPVRVSTTILWGEADAYMSGALLERSVKKIIGRSLRVATGSHHTPRAGCSAAVLFRGSWDAAGLAAQPGPRPIGNDGTIRPDLTWRTYRAHRYPTPRRHHPPCGIGCSVRGDTTRAVIALRSQLHRSGVAFPR